MTSTNNTSSPPGSEMLPTTAVISLVILGGAWSLPTYDGGGIDAVPGSQDLSFAESLLDFASSTTFEWGFPNDDSIEENYDEAEESGPEALEVLQAEEDPEPSSTEIEETDHEGDDTDMQEIVESDDAEFEDGSNETGRNGTIQGTNLRIETGLFFDASKGGEESCDESDYDYDDDCDDDDDDGERGLLKKILFFLPSSVQPKPNTTKNANKSSSIGQTEIVFPTNSSVVNLTAENEVGVVNITENVDVSSGSLAVSNSSTRQPRPNLDEIFQLMESLASRGGVSWLAALLFLI